jgi:hypothetical protein
MPKSGAMRDVTESRTTIGALCKHMLDRAQLVAAGRYVCRLLTREIARK